MFGERGKIQTVNSAADSISALEKSTEMQFPGLNNGSKAGSMPHLVPVLWGQRGRNHEAVR